MDGISELLGWDHGDPDVGANIGQKDRIRWKQRLLSMRLLSLFFSLLVAAWAPNSELTGGYCLVNGQVSLFGSSPDSSHSRLNPRPGGGLSHLRHGGGGGQNDPPPLTRKLGKLEGRATRQSTALSEPVRSHFGHFFAHVNIEVSRGHQRSNFRKMMVLSGMPAIISGTIIATPNPKKATDSS